MNKQFECENCKKKFTTKQRKMNHFKICNYANLERKITDLQFEIFTLKSNNYNTNRNSKDITDKFIKNINTLTNMLEDFKEINN